MPSKKQRRRREKERRHEFEEAYLDAEGNEISREEYEALVSGTTAQAVPGRNGTHAKPIQRGSRTIHPPSWRRVFRRAALFAPLMALTLYFLSPDEATTPSIVLSTVYLMALFIPFSYFMDRLMYRRFAAKAGRPAARGPAKR